MGYNEPIKAIQAAVSMPPLVLNNRFYLMRHGESVANKKGLIVSQPENGVSDYGLTHNGVMQVTEVAVNSRLNRDVLIVSSDFKRAYETAEIMHSVLAVKQTIITHEGLRERGFGQLELQDTHCYQQVWDNDISESLEVNNHKQGIEPLQSVLDRSLAAVRALDATTKNKKFLLVSHGDVLQILATHFRQQDIRQHRQMRALKNADIRLL